MTDAIHQSHDAFLAFLSSILGILGSVGLLLASRLQGAVYGDGLAVDTLYALFWGTFLVSSAFLTRELYDCGRRSVILRHLPGPRIPLVQGMAALMQERKDHHRLLSEWAEEFGPIYRTRFLMFHAVVVTDPTQAMRVLRSRRCDKLPFQYKLLNPFLGGTNLLTGQTDDHWRVTRKAVAPAFSSKNLRSAFQGLVSSATELADKLKCSKAGTAYNIENLLLSATMDMIGRFGFDHDLKNVEKLEPSASHELKGSFAQLLLDCAYDVTCNFREVLWFARVWRADVRKSWSHYDSFLAEIRRIYKGCLELKETPSFVSLLLKAKHPRTGNALAEKRMIAEMATLFFAGSDTTAHTAAWALYRISQSKTVEDKIMAELQSLNLAGAHDRRRPVAYVDLTKLPYLDAVIKETLRLYPPVGAGQVRLVNADMTLSSKIKVPAGALIWIPHHGVHTSSLNWEQGKEFIPERWLKPGMEYATGADGLETKYDGNNETSEDVGAADDLDSYALVEKARRYFPFGEGPRNCLGQALARTMLPVLLATLLADYEFKLAPEAGGPEGVHASEVTTMITGTKEGILMNVQPRQSVDPLQSYF